MRMEQGVRTGLGHGGITCVLQTQFSSFRIIYNMYQGIKSCVSHSSEQSDFFQSFRGVRQSENLSPVLFALFLNDLESFLNQNSCNGIDLEIPDEPISRYIKMFVLLYADDTAIFGTSEENFQHNLNIFYEYSKIWKLDINFDKTKILIFGTRNGEKYEFRLGENIISICEEFKYLGVIFTKSRSFYKVRKHNVDQARKALHVLYKRIRNLNLPIDLQLQLFDHTILPIALYSCEVWGFENTQLIENLHNEFLRRITNLKKSAPIYMLHAELGRLPIEINIKIAWLDFGYQLSMEKRLNCQTFYTRYFCMIIIRVFMSINGYDISEIYSFPWVELSCFTNAILITLGRSKPQFLELLLMYIFRTGVRK